MKLQELYEARTLGSQQTRYTIAELRKIFDKQFPEEGGMGSSLESRLYDDTFGVVRRTCPVELEKHLVKGDEYCWQLNFTFKKGLAKNKNQVINLAYRKLKEKNVPQPQAADCWLINRPGDWDHNRWFVRLFYVGEKGDDQTLK